MKKLLLLLSLITFVNASAQFCFRPVDYYAGGGSPNFTLSADFNNDGNPDVAVLNFVPSNSFGIYIGNGDGTFVNPVFYATGNVPYAMANGDFNNDGNQDIVVANSADDSVSVYMGNGTGVFGLPVNYLVGDDPGGVIVEDVNQDGKPDILTSNYASSDITVLTGVGNGTFLFGGNYTTGSNPTAFLAVDFTGDGVKDLAVLAGSGYSIMNGNGSGSFPAYTDFVTAGAYYIASADFNGDAKADLAISHGSSNNISVRTGVGNGTFNLATTIPTGNNPYGLCTSDFNNDGKKDIAVVCYNANEVNVFPGNGNATFGAPWISTDVFWPQHIAAADFNNDGKSDLVIADAGVVVINNGLPSALITGNASICVGHPNVLYASGADSYIWSANAGSSTDDSVVVSPVTPTTYTVYGINNTCADTASATITVSAGTAATPSICMVTVDSMSINNEIFWDKTLYPELDSMIIYREVTSNVYKRIAALSKNALSMYVDTARSVGPANGDPNIGTYRYKIQMRDTCGNYSLKSLWHNTVFFINSSGTFFWNRYEIEGDPVPTNTTNPMTQFDLGRDDFAPTGNFNVVGSVAGTQTTLNDPNYLAYQTTADWRVFAIGLSCNPTFRQTSGGNNEVQAGIVKSRSNIKTNRVVNPNGIKEITNQLLSVKVYPNPATDVVTIEVADLKETATIEIVNVLGQVAFTSETIAKTTSINTSNFNTGVYFVKVSTLNSVSAIRLIVE